MIRPALVGLPLAVSAASVQAQTTSFVDVPLVRLGEGDILPSQAVVVTGGRVTAVGLADATSTPEGGVTVDGRGCYLLPGLVVLHGLMPKETRMDWREALLVYLAHGLTTIVVSGSDLAVLHRARAEGENFGRRPALASGGAPGAFQGAAAQVWTSRWRRSGSLRSSRVPRQTSSFWLTIRFGGDAYLPSAVTS